MLPEGEDRLVHGHGGTPVFRSDAPAFVGEPTDRDPEHSGLPARLGGVGTGILPHRTRVWEDRARGGY
ncbi:hypothetical protein GCM10027590_26590 [Nocardiopsis nanhaiensis]